MISEKDLLSNAIKLAVDGHRNQLDKIGMPYILHPLAVMFAVDTIPQKIVAILHDYLEDTEGTVYDLWKIGCNFDIIYSIECITHLPNEPNIRYYERILSDPTGIARIVKLADIAHNSSPARMRGLPITDQERMLKKYAYAKEKLC
jgi:guanosine-3',5'-bis(diphosphate) 3'-pyrophosphohydrolase